MRVKKMSKELERVKEEIISRLNDNFEDDIYGTSRRILNLKLENINLQIQIEHLMQPAIQKKLLEPMPPMFIKQLPPPTQEEVCEALSEDIEWSVVYQDKQFRFGIDEQWLIRLGETNRLEFNCRLKIETLKMVVKFYEGKKNE